MMRRRTLLRGAALVAALPRLASGNTHAAAPIRIATTPGPLADVVDQLATLAARQGLDVRVETRTDPRRIDADVQRGALDASAFETGVAFTDATQERDTGLVVAASTVTLPMGLYSRRLASPQQLRDGDRVALPADPAGQARALVLLQNFGLVILRDDVGLHATLHDVVANPRRLRLAALPAARLFAALDSAPVVVIDSADARRAGLLPGRDSIGIEDARTPFAGVLVLRRDRLAEPWVAPLITQLHGEDMKRFLLERFGDSVRRPW